VLTVTCSACTMTGPHRRRSGAAITRGVRCQPPNHAMDRPASEPATHLVVRHVQAQGVFHDVDGGQHSIQVVKWLAHACVQRGEGGQTGQDMLKGQVQGEQPTLDRQTVTHATPAKPCSSLHVHPGLLRPLCTWPSRCQGSQAFKMGHRTCSMGLYCSDLDAV
jgi:hypothetical protein